jgi:hypothetical protein
VASGVVKNQNISNEITPMRVAKIAAFVLLMTPVTIGRFDVRAINLSMSLSITILKAFALPADNVPAIIVAIVKENEGRPLAAKTMAGKVETRSSSTTRSFIRSR